MSLFRTTANTQFNSLGAPFNPANLNAGWGINPNYLTPAFDAQYRPGWAGSSGMGAYSDPSFFQSVNQIYSPFSPSYMYGNPVDSNQPYMESIYGRPQDRGMQFAQRFAAPMASYWAAFKLASIQTNRANGLASRALGKMAYGSSYFSDSLFSNKTAGEIHNAATAAADRAAARQGIFGYIGDQAGQGVARGFMGIGQVFRPRGIFAPGVEAAASRTAIAEGVGAVTGGIAGFALPMMMAEGAMKAFDGAIGSPYVAQRMMGRDLRANFSNIYLGQGYGKPETGTGLSFAASQRMAGQLSQFAASDMTFSQGQIAAISDLAAKNGLLDNASGDQIVDRIKSISGQVKVLMRIANEPDFKKAMEMVANLKNSGLSEAGAPQALNRLGGYAAMAGISVQRLMQTVGAQGQYLYQANGMVPYLGQLAAGQSLGAFSSAYRSGLISTGLMASMGGVEGAEQSSLTGMINASQTPYNRMLMMNRYMLGNKVGATNVVGQMTAFGHSFVRNPWEVAGMMGMYGPMMGSMQSKERGPLALQDQIMAYAKNLPGATGKNGKVSAGAAYFIMTQAMGLGHDQALAWLQQMRATSDTGTLNVMQGQLQGNTVKQLEAFAEQNHISGGPVTGFMNYWGHRAFNGVQKYGSKLIQGIQESFGGVTDSVEKSFHDYMYGDQYGAMNGSVSDFYGRNGTRVKRFKGTGTTLIGLDGSPIQTSSEALSRLNSLASSNSQVQKLMDTVQHGGSLDDIQNILVSLASKGALGEDFKGQGDGQYERIVNLSKQLKNTQVVGSNDIPQFSMASKVQSRLRNVLANGDNILQSAETIHAATTIQRALLSGQNPDDVMKSGAWKIFSQNYKGKNNLELRKLSYDISMSASRNGELQVGDLLGQYGTVAELRKAVQKDPEGVLGKQAGAAWRKAKSLQEQDRIITASRWAKAGLSAHDAQFNYMPDDMSLSDRFKLDDIGGAYRKQISENHKLHDAGKIDFQTTMQMDAATTLSQAVSNFGGFVQKFGESISKNASGESPGFWSSLTGAPSDSAIMARARDISAGKK